MILIGMGLGILGVGLGFILGLILTVMFASRSLSFGLPAQSRAGNAGASGVYLEAFAVWMGTFQVGSLLIARLPLQNALIAALGINMLGAMGVGILWAVVRGIPWSVLREDLGWHLGRGLFIEPWCGLMGYLATLPLLIVGVVLMLILGSLAGAVFPQEAVSDPFAPLEVPMHPIVSWVADGNRGVLLQLGLMACVVAPFEETLFRGFLLRYLRDASRWTGVGVSFLFSALFNSLIFAAIHPQGPIAIPVLMAIACGLSILREWRGSLLGPMVAHGLNNSIVMAILFGAVW
jgi:membrane protease YdiL (CAAX protease family)